MANVTPTTTPLPQHLAAASTKELISFYDYATSLVDHAGAFLNQPRCQGLPREWLEQSVADLYGLADRIGAELLTRSDECDERAPRLTHYLRNWFEEGDGLAVCSVLRGIAAQAKLGDAA